MISNYYITVTIWFVKNICVRVLPNWTMRYCSQLTFLIMQHCFLYCQLWWSANLLCPHGTIQLILCPCPIQTLWVYVFHSFSIAIFCDNAVPNYMDLDLYMSIFFSCFSCVCLSFMLFLAQVLLYNYVVDLSQCYCSCLSLR